MEAFHVWDEIMERCTWWNQRRRNCVTDSVTKYRDISGDDIRWYDIRRISWHRTSSVRCERWLDDRLSLHHEYQWVRYSIKRSAAKSAMQWDSDWVSWQMIHNAQPHSPHTSFHLITEWQWVRPSSPRLRPVGTKWVVSCQLWRANLVALTAAQLSWTEVRWLTWTFTTNIMHSDLTYAWNGSLRPYNMINRVCADMMHLTWDVKYKFEAPYRQLTSQTDVKVTIASISCRNSEYIQ